MAEKNQRGGVRLKRVLVIALVSVFVFGISMVTMADSLDGNQMSVLLTLLPYARIEVPEGLDLGVIDFYEGFNERRLDATLNLFTNTNVHVHVSSRGFGFENRFVWETQPIYYHIVQQNGNILSFTSGGSHGGWGDYGFNWTGEMIEIPFRVWFRRINADNFYKIEAKEWTDVITLTVSAR